MGAHTGRVCFRCGRDLTDAASMEEGIGPVCRKLDNAVLAARIPADVAAARVIMSEVNAERLLPECLNAALDVMRALNDSSALTRADWRKEVKRIEWLLSFAPNAANEGAHLTGVVRALGYVGLAALWAGKASSGVAQLRLVGNRLHLTGPRNTDFRFEVKRVEGWRFHPPQGDVPAEWSVPVTQYAAFNAIVTAYYPNCPTREATIAHAQGLVNAVTTGTPAPKAESKVRVEENGEWLRVFAPYNGGFISAVKRLPYSDRKWSPTERCWEVAAQRRDSLTELLQQFYQVQPTVAPLPMLVTPALLDVPVSRPVTVAPTVLPF